MKPKMKHYMISIEEKAHVEYVVEASSSEEANKLFINWLDNNMEEVADCLSRSASDDGWEVTYPSKTNDNVDITYAELLSAWCDENDNEVSE